MTLVLHHHPFSSNAQKVRLMLDVVGADYELREVPFEVERAEWHVAVNPTGGIPALVDDGLRLAESNAMLRYLADRAGRDDLYPRDLRERATVDWILDLWATSMRPALFAYETARYGIVLGRGIGAADPAPAAEVQALFDKAVSRLEPALRVLDPAGPWACLGRMTIADIAAAPVLHRLLLASVDVSALPRLATWAEACVAIPEWRARIPGCGVPLAAEPEPR